MSSLISRVGYVGEFTPAKTVVIKFNTHQATGAPITLAGTPAVSVYKNSTTESTSGVTLTVDYDSRTGMHQVAIDTSSDGTFYAAGNDFDVVITTGTVDSVSAVGAIVGTFSLSNRAGLRPTTADRTLDVAATGEAGLDFNNVLSSSLCTLHSLTVTGATTLTGAVTMAAGLAITQTASNTSALVITGNGTGHGAIITSGSGATGNGVQIVAASTNGVGLNVAGVGTGSAVVCTGGATGHGISLVGGATSGNGLRAAGTAGNSQAVYLAGQGSAAGMYVVGGATGAGVQFVGGATSGDGAQFTATTSGDGLQLTAAGSSVFGLRCADLLDTVVIETGINGRQALALIGAATTGKASGLPSGPAVFKGMDNTTARISATVDADGNRSAVTLSPPA